MRTRAMNVAEDYDNSAQAEPNPGAVALCQHDRAPHDPLRRLVDCAELPLAQQRVQHGDQLANRERRAQTAFDAAPERHPRVGLRSGAEESLRAELVGMLVSVW